MRKLQYLFTALAAMCFAVPAFAQAGAASPAINLIPVGVGLGMGLAAGLCGMGQGRAVASASEAVARNPGTRGAIQIFLILGLAFIESLTLFTMVMIFLKM
jgi:F-type H+-transporting ATPase subunit c